MPRAPRPIVAQPIPPTTPSIPQIPPSQTPIYIPPAAMSPRVQAFVPPFGYTGPPQPLQPSPMPRNFPPGAAPFETHNHTHYVPPPPRPPPQPIGPPPKSRRMSTSVDPGPITRPVIAPIARPDGGSGSGSPNRRSPSPKGVVLGSSALAADDDEVVGGGGRRGSANPSWGTTEAPRTPWGPPLQPVSIHPAYTGNRNNAPPLSAGGLWAAPSQEWHPATASPGQAGFFASAYNASPPH